LRECYSANSDKLMEMEQMLVGSGTLSDEVGTTRTVQFKFKIKFELIQGPGGQTALGKARTQGGSVSANDGQPISEGVYRIDEPDGKHWRVQKLGTQWHLLSPPTG
jgi:hypothetical protein